MDDLTQLQINLSSARKLLTNPTSQDIELVKVDVQRSEAIVGALKDSRKASRKNRILGVVGLLFIVAGVYTGDVSSEDLITFAVHYLSMVL